MFAGTANNAGAILVLGRDLVVVPKLIHPIPPPLNSSEDSSEHHMEDTWMQVCNWLLLPSTVFFTDVLDQLFVCLFFKAVKLLLYSIDT